jgi:hypothetical protein
MLCLAVRLVVTTHALQPAFDEDFILTLFVDEKRPS